MLQRSISPPFYLRLLFAGSLLLHAGCAIFATRPVQEMADTAAALRAAREVQADTLVPELYRRAAEEFLKAKNEYKFKNFNLAKEYAEKARKFAEEAEYQSIRQGVSRSESPFADPMQQGIQSDPPPERMKSPPPPYPYPTPEPSSVDPAPPAGG